LKSRRHTLALLLGAAAAACSTSSSLSHRPLSEGTSRTFAGDFARVSAAVDAAIETLPVNILAPFNVRGARVVRFDRPMTALSWGESGRVVVWPSVVNTTRITVAVDIRDPSRPSALVEREYAQQIFRHVQQHLASAPGGSGS
jgi:hypothetical protein